MSGGTVGVICVCGAPKHVRPRKRRYKVLKRHIIHTQRGTQTELFGDSDSLQQFHFQFQLVGGVQVVSMMRNAIIIGLFQVIVGNILKILILFKLLE